MKDNNGVEITNGCTITDGSIVDEYGTQYRAKVKFIDGLPMIESSNCKCEDCGTNIPVQDLGIRNIKVIKESEL